MRAQITRLSPSVKRFSASGPSRAISLETSIRRQRRIHCLQLWVPLSGLELFTLWVGPLRVGQGCDAWTILLLLARRSTVRRIGPITRHLLRWQIFLVEMWTTRRSLSLATAMSAMCLWGGKARRNGRKQNSSLGPGKLQLFRVWWTTCLMWLQRSSTRMVGGSFGSNTWSRCFREQLAFYRRLVFAYKRPGEFRRKQHHTRKVYGDEETFQIRRMRKLGERLREWERQMARGVPEQQLSNLRSKIVGSSLSGHSHG